MSRPILLHLATNDGMRMKTVNTIIKNSILVLLLASLPMGLAAKDDGNRGKEKSKVCEACHGPDGKGIDPSYPNLAGQHKSYLVKALGDYRAGRRTNLIMAGFAGPLSDQDIKDLAAWYSSLDGLKDITID
jgi:cytochrome c553